MMTPARSGRPVGNGSGGASLIRRHPSQFGSNSLPIPSPRSAYPGLEPHIRSVTVQYFGAMGYPDGVIPSHMDESGRFQTIEEGVQVEDDEEGQPMTDPRAARMIEYEYNQVHTPSHSAQSMDRYHGGSHNRDMPPPSPRFQRSSYSPHAQGDSQVFPENYGTHAQPRYDDSQSYSHQARETAPHTTQPTRQPDSTHRSAMPFESHSHLTPELAHNAQPQQYNQHQSDLTPQHLQYPHPQAHSTLTIPDHPYSSQAGSGYQQDQDFHPQNQQMPQDLTRDDDTIVLHAQGQAPRVSLAEPANRQLPPPRFAENRNKPQVFARPNPQAAIKQDDNHSTPGTQAPRSKSQWDASSVPTPGPTGLAGPPGPVRTKEEAMQEFQAQKKALGSQKTRSPQDKEEVDRKAMPPPTMAKTATLGSQLQVSVIRQLLVRSEDS
jgi:hypothetical protein